MKQGIIMIIERPKKRNDNKNYKEIINMAIVINTKETYKPRKFKHRTKIEKIG